MGWGTRPRNIYQTSITMALPKQMTSMIDVLKNMSPALKSDLIHQHHEFGRLKELCRAKGYIEVIPNMGGIRVINHTDDVLALKKVVDKLNPGGFQWKDGE